MVEELFVYCVQEAKLQMEKLYKGVNAEKQISWRMVSTSETIKDIREGSKEIFW